LLFTVAARIPALFHRTEEEAIYGSKNLYQGMERQRRSIAKAAGRLQAIAATEPGNNAWL
jgi:hypothetical protein